MSLLTDFYKPCEFKELFFFLSNSFALNKMVCNSKQNARESKHKHSREKTERSL